MRSVLSAILLMISACYAGLAQVPQKLSPLTRQFVSVNAPVVALTHVRVIDGTGYDSAKLIESVHGAVGLH